MDNETKTEYICWLGLLLFLIIVYLVGNALIPGSKYEKYQIRPVISSEIILDEI